MPIKKKSLLIKKYFFLKRTQYKKNKEKSTTIASATNTEKINENGIKNINILINKIRIIYLTVSLILTDFYKK